MWVQITDSKNIPIKGKVVTSVYMVNMWTNVKYMYEIDVIQSFSQASDDSGILRVPLMVLCLPEEGDYKVTLVID